MGISSTHPNVALTLARCQRELTPYYMNSEQEKRQKERDETEGHCDGGSGEEGKGQTDPAPVTY